MSEHDDIFRLAGHPKFIPGIYNYCDRWCERCTFTQQCYLFATSEAMEKGENRKYSDDENKSFWLGIDESAEDTLENFADEFFDDEFDIDPEELEEAKKERQEQKDFALSHSLSQRSRNYMLMTKDFLKSDEKLYKLLSEPYEEFEARKQENTENRLIDAVEVILWYHMQIHVKTYRALSSRRDEEEDEFDDMPKDSDGSAKVALLGIDRSIGAWGVLIHELAERRDDILTIMSYLKRLRDDIEKEFPDARKFVRPGFDTQS